MSNFIFRVIYGNYVELELYELIIGLIDRFLIELIIFRILLEKIKSNFFWERAS